MTTTKFTQNFDVIYINQETTIQLLRFKFRIPDGFKANLNRKKVRVQKFRMNNLFIPIHIPPRVYSQQYLDDVRTAQQAYVLTVPGNPFAPGNYAAQPPNYFGGVFTPPIIPSLLDYWTQNLFTFGAIQALLIQTYLQPDVINPKVPIPDYVIKDDSQYYSSQGYYYYDMSKFLGQIEKQANDSFNARLSAADQALNTIWVIIQYTTNAEGRTEVTLFLNTKYHTQNPDVTPTLGNFFGMSNKLLEILPFSNTPNPGPNFYHDGDMTDNFQNGGSSVSSYLDFGPQQTVIAGETYLSTTCVLYDNFFPFTELLLNSDTMNVMPTAFMSDSQLNSNNSDSVPESTLLAFDIGTDDPLSIYNFYTYTNNSNSQWQNFVYPQNGNATIDIYLLLRLRNLLIIPMQLRPNELFKITLELQTEITDTP